jgi:hypothetical protein
MVTKLTNLGLAFWRKGDVIDSNVTSVGRTYNAFDYDLREKKNMVSDMDISTQTYITINRDMAWKLDNFKVFMSCGFMRDVFT